MTQTDHLVIPKFVLNPQAELAIPSLMEKVRADIEAGQPTWVNESTYFEHEEELRPHRHLVRVYRDPVTKAPRVKSGRYRVLSPKVIEIIPESDTDDDDE